MIGRPSVTLTAWPKPACFSTGRPWSWYIASTASHAREPARQEGRVRRHRALEPQAQRAQAFERRRDHLDLLAAQVPDFAGVRIEAAARGCGAGARRSGRAGRASMMREQRARAARAVMAALTLGERQVRRRERHAQPAADQQHHGQRRPRRFGEVFGVAGERDARVVDRRPCAPAP